MLTHLEIMEEEQVESLQRRYVGTQIEELCRSHERMAKYIESLSGKEESNEEVLPNSGL